MRTLLGALGLSLLLSACPRPEAQDSSGPPPGARADPPPGAAPTSKPGAKDFAQLSGSGASDKPDFKSAFQHAVRYDGERSAVVVDVEVKPGFHVYTVGETIGKPLRLTLDEESAFAADGEVQYPKGETKELPIGRSVIVEGKAEVVAKVKPRGPDGTEARGKFRYQVCTDEACDRPRTEPFSVAVK